MAYYPPMLRFVPFQRGLFLISLLLLLGFGFAQGVGSEALNFTLLDADTNPIRLSDFSGTPLILNFWASWCPPCVEELPFLVKVVNQLNENQIEPRVQVLLINNSEDAEVAKAFLHTDLAIDVPVALEPSRDQIASFKQENIDLNTSLDVAKAYRVRGLPTSIFIDSKGIIQAVKVGFLLPVEMPALLSTIGLDWQPNLE